MVASSAVALFINSISILSTRKGSNKNGEKPDLAKTEELKQLSDNLKEVRLIACQNCFLKIVR